MEGNKSQNAILKGDSSGLGSQALAKSLGGETNTAKRLDCYLDQERSEKSTAKIAAFAQRKRPKKAPY